jgi:hypothetical protein
VRICSTITLFFVSVISFAQAVPPDSVKKKQPYRAIVKWSPFHLINFYPSLQLAFELQLNNRHSIQLDAGFVLDAEENNHRYKNKRGVKLKSEWRYYIEDNTQGHSTYLSLEPYTNLINFDRIESKVECFDVDCTILYTREYNYMVRYRETGISFKFGNQFQSGKFFFDFNFGLTLRDINYKKPTIPIGFNEPPPRGWVFRNEDKRVTFGPALGIRAGYLLSKVE